MYYVLLGADHDLLQLAESLATTDGAMCLAAYDVPAEWREPLLQSLGDIPIRDDWEGLLHDPRAEVVLVAAMPDGDEPRERRAEQLRKLAAAPLVLVGTHPVCEAIVGFELEMIRRDVAVPLAVYHPDLEQPALQRLRSLAEKDSELGRLEQLVIERAFQERSVPDLKRQLARDMLLVRFLLGDIRRVSALGGALTDGPFHLSAQIDTHRDCLVRWSMVPATGAPELRLQLFGTRGTAEASRRQASWTLSPEEKPPAGDSSQTSASRAAGRLAAQPQTVAMPASWMDGARAQEVAEAVERSAQRRRTIEIFNEQHSEEDTFKGVMAVGSCGLLMVVLLVLMVGAVIEGMRYPYARARWREEQSRLANQQDPSAAAEAPAPPADGGTPLWLRLWPVYPLVAFLLLQLLRVLARRPPPRRPAAES